MKNNIFLLIFSVILRIFTFLHLLSFGVNIDLLQNLMFFDLLFNSLLCFVFQIKLIYTLICIFSIIVKKACFEFPSFKYRPGANVCVFFLLKFQFQDDISQKIFLFQRHAPQFYFLRIHYLFISTHWSINSSAHFKTYSHSQPKSLELHSLYDILSHHYNQSMQNISPQSEGTQLAAQRRVLFSKLLSTAARIILYFLSIKSNGSSLLSGYINILIGVGLYLLLLAAVWYRAFGLSLPSRPFSPYLTVAMHLSGIINILLFALSIKLQEVQPQQFFFQILISQMVNYVLTLIVLYEVAAAVVAKDFKNFLQIYEPVEDSLILLFMGYLVGTIFDFLAFAQTALNELYILVGIVAFYGLVKAIFFKNWIMKLKCLFSQ